MLKRATKFYFTEQSTEPQELDSETVSSWIDAADRRDMSEAFQQMHNMFEKLKFRAPLRVYRMRRDIAWLVKQADRDGLRW